MLTLVRGVSLRAAPYFPALLIPYRQPSGRALIAYDRGLIRGMEAVQRGLAQAEIRRGNHTKVLAARLVANLGPHTSTSPFI